MFKRILVAHDGSEGARAALGMGIALAKSLGVDLSTVSVEEHLPRYAATVSEVQAAKEEIDEYFHKLTKEARDAALLQGVELETIVRQGHEVKTILSVTREGRFDLLVIGYYGHSRVFEQIVGSTALSVARVAPCSVMFVRPQRPSREGIESIKRILVGADGSPLGRLALRTAVDLAILCGAAVIGVTVQEAPSATRPEELDWGFIQQLRTAAEEHTRAAGVPFELVTRTGHAAQILREQALESRADLIVLGATGVEHPWSVTIGGTATRVASEAPCAVLLVRLPQTVLHVRDVMVRAVSSITIDASLSDVVELLLRRDVKAVPVVDARRHVVGLITGGDLLRRGELGLRLSLKRELDEAALREDLRAIARSRKSARDVMTRHVYTIDADADLATAIRVMARREVKRLPVVDRDGELVGVVSRADVFRAIAALPATAERAERELPTVARTIGDAVITEVPVVPPSAPAEEVLQIVLESPLRRVVVVGPDNRVLGLISDRDLLVRSSPDARPWLLRLLRGPRSGLTVKHLTGTGPSLTAADVMAPLLITVRPADSLARAIQLMMQHKVKRLIVVDDDGHFRGLVDRREILRLLASEPRPETPHVD
jgi:nucleotide-binding universal stress UspA family protein/CBS-domain-containing membrane protein